MKLLLAEWLSWAAPGAVALLLLFWFILFAEAMKPEKGTLEWIARTERKRYPALTLKPMHASGWLVLGIVVLLGFAKAVLFEKPEAENGWIAAAVSAAQYVICSLTLQLLYGVPTAALCGSVLLMAADIPSPMLLICLFLLFLSLCFRAVWIQLLFYIPAVICLFSIVGVSFSVLLILIGYLLLYLLLAPLHRERSFWNVAGGTLLLLVFTCAALFAEAILTAEPGEHILEAVPETLRSLIQWTPVWHQQTNGVVLLSGVSIFALLYYAAKVRDTRWLAGSVIGLLSFQQLFCGLPEVTYLGCILALTGTFSAAIERRRKAAASITAALLTICILIS